MFMQYKKAGFINESSLLFNLKLFYAYVDVNVNIVVVNVKVIVSVIALSSALILKYKSFVVGVDDDWLFFVHASCQQLL